MKKKLIYLTILAILSSIICAANFKKPILCPDSSISCALNNFNKLFKQDYNHFWSIFHTAGEAAGSCEDKLKTTSFLEAAGVKKGNAEFNEYFMGIIENHLIINKTECFLEALKQTNTNSRKIILNDLRNPIFIDKSNIDRSLERFYNDSRYKDMLKFYTEGP